MKFSRFVIVTGLSGAGKSQAMKSFEDLGFFCIDNLPPALLIELARLGSAAGYARMAVAPDVRTGGPFGDAPAALERLAADGVDFEVLYLDADDDTIVRRYSETRRRHPLEGEVQLAEAVTREREELAPFRARATHLWDTSGFNLAALKGKIVATYACAAGEHKLAAHIVAFGYKHGVPRDVDLVFDVRFLPNPHYDDALRSLRGTDEPVIRFMETLPETERFLTHLFDMVAYLVPLYIAEGKSRLTIAIGCTGGRHRSVYVAERLATFLRAFDTLAVTVENRELVPA